MAEISRLLFLRHLRSEATCHVLRFSSGRPAGSGPGLSFWFLPLTTSIAEVPVDDRELPFLVRIPTADFQEVAVQGSVAWRVVDPEGLARRVDFHLDLTTGRYREEPLERIAGVLLPLARELAERSVLGLGLRQVLERGTEPIRTAMESGLRGEPAVTGLGLEVVAVRVGSLRAEAEVEKALQTPTRERVQQEADEATFRRRALAVEKERAIQENELQNRIELAIREQGLIERRGLNERRRAEEEALALRISADATAERAKVEAEAEASRIRAVEAAKVEAEQARMAIYRDLSGTVLMGLAAQGLADKLQRIDHLHVSPDLMGSLLGDLVSAGTRKLEGGS